MSNELPEYGLWWLVALNSALFIVFALSFFRPRSPRDWRSFGAFSAFLVALFTEMYGFPLTIYLLSGWLSTAFPGVDWFAHDSGHLLETIFGWGGNPHIGPFHLLSSVFVFGGFLLLVAAWRVLYRAQRTQTVATTGAYALVRHPQYVAFISIMFGFLLQWPTLPTLVMFPILVAMYARLARREEREVLAGQGDEYRSYSERTPPFLPNMRHAAGLAAVVLLIFGVPALIAYAVAVPLRHPGAGAPVAESVPGNFAAGVLVGDAMERAQVQVDALKRQMRSLEGTPDPALRRALALSHLAALGQMGEMLRGLDSSLVEDVEGGSTTSGSKLRQRLKLDAQVMDMQLEMLKAQAGGAGESLSDAAARETFFR
jgi:protein-S-isoprenylcysteine O-methyltransferase Ste14